MRTLKLIQNGNSYKDMVVTSKLSIVGVNPSLKSGWYAKPRDVTNLCWVIADNNTISFDKYLPHNLFNRYALEIRRSIKFIKRQKVGV
jgi:hypothetical protein